MHYMYSCLLIARSTTFDLQYTPLFVFPLILQWGEISTKRSSTSVPTRRQNENVTGNETAALDALCCGVMYWVRLSWSSPSLSEVCERRKCARWSTARAQSPSPSHCSSRCSPSCPRSSQTTGSGRHNYRYYRHSSRKKVWVVKSC